MNAPLRLTAAEAVSLAASLSEMLRPSKGSPVGKLIAALASGRSVEVINDPR